MLNYSSRRIWLVITIFTMIHFDRMLGMECSEVKRQRIFWCTNEITMITLLVLNFYVHSFDMTIQVVFCSKFLVTFITFKIFDPTCGYLLRYFGDICCMCLLINWNTEAAKAHQQWKSGCFLIICSWSSERWMPSMDACKRDKYSNCRP